MHKYFSLLFYIFISTNCLSQEKSQLTLKEQEDAELFKNFISHINSALIDRRNLPALTESGNMTAAQIKHLDSLKLMIQTKTVSEINDVLANYILVFNNTGISQDEILNRAERELSDFFQFAEESTLENLEIKPLRLCKDSISRHIYNSMNDFQKENAFVMLNKKFPGSVLCYLLFIPGETIKTKTPRILSWKLGFFYGHYYYTDILGNAGSEIFWDGVKGPKYPVEL